MPTMPVAARALVLAGFVLLGAPAAGYAVPCEQGQHVGNPHCAPPAAIPDPRETPELDSFVLFGAGLLGLAGVAVIRRRRVTVGASGGA